MSVSITIHKFLNNYRRLSDTNGAYEGAGVRLFHTLLNMYTFAALKKWLTRSDRIEQGSADHTIKKLTEKTSVP